VTRLEASRLLREPCSRRRTYQILGRLYAGLIFPDTAEFDLADICRVAGIPVVTDGEDVSVSAGSGNAS
jgi:hypothetical protein